MKKKKKKKKKKIRYFIWNFQFFDGEFFQYTLHGPQDIWVIEVDCMSNANSKVPDQTTQMPRLISVFIRRYHLFLFK